MLFFFKNKLFLASLLLILFFSNYAFSLNAPDCEFLANVEEEKKDLPNGILSSISRVEAGRIQINGNKKGWPWTVNHAGEGMFFESKNDAIKYVNDSISRGDINLDVGCMQISVKWHSTNFSSLEDMFDPEKNISYASKFLIHLFKNHGDWKIAIKHYHSADPRKNLKYLKKVLAVWSKNKVSEQKPNETAKIFKANIILPISRPLMNINKKKYNNNEKNNENLIQTKTKIVQNIPKSLPTKPKFINDRWLTVEKFRKEFSKK